MTDVRLHVGITHAAFDAKRRAMLPKLLHDLEPLPVVVEADSVKGRRSGFAAMLACLNRIQATNATHAVLLDDDAGVCPNFAQHLTKCISEAPQGNCLISLFCNVVGADKHGTNWVSTTDSITGIGWVIPVEWIPKFFDLVPRLPSELHSDDAINLWAMLAGRDIYYPIPSFVEHLEPNTTITGTDLSSTRTNTVRLLEADEQVQWNGACTFLGRKYDYLHWNITTVFDNKSLAYHYARQPKADRP